MTIKKRTVNDLLKIYLEDKDLDEEDIKNILKSLHKDVKTKEDGETVASHGTSCPRISTKKGDLLFEM